MGNHPIEGGAKINFAEFWYVGSFAKSDFLVQRIFGKFLAFSCQSMTKTHRFHPRAEFSMRA